MPAPGGRPLMGRRVLMPRERVEAPASESREGAPGQRRPPAAVSPTGPAREQAQSLAAVWLWAAAPAAGAEAARPAAGPRSAGPAAPTAPRSAAARLPAPAAGKGTARAAGPLSAPQRARARMRSARAVEPPAEGAVSAAG